MSFLFADDLDGLFFALLIRDRLSEDERRALVLELGSHRRAAHALQPGQSRAHEIDAVPVPSLPSAERSDEPPNDPPRNARCYSKMRG